MGGSSLIGQSTPAAGDNQQWLIEQTGDGKYRVVSRASAGVLSVLDAGMSVNAGITLVKPGADSLTGPAQEWTFSAP